MSKKLNLIRYFGGKHYLLDFIYKFIIYEGVEVYVEPFGGSGKVLLNKMPHKIEVFNDIDKKLISLFRVIQDDERFKDFFYKVFWTLYSREEYKRVKEIYFDEGITDEIESAWSVFVGFNMGFSGTLNSWSYGFTRNKPLAFQNKIMNLFRIRERLKGVYIENSDALEVIKRWDSERTLFYCDPPYPLEARKGGKEYNYELDDEYHFKLIDELAKVKGYVILSSYQNDIYDRLIEKGWRRYEKEMFLSSQKKKSEAKDRVKECVYINPKLSGVIEDSDKKEEVFFMEEEGKEINEMNDNACG